MNKKYFITTIRHLWHARLFTALNMCGLAVSIGAAWIIFRIVDFEFSYDRDLANKDGIYRVVTGFIFDEKESYNGGASAPLYQSIRNQVSGVIFAVPLMDQWVQSVRVNTSNAPPLEFDHPSHIAATDSTYFSLIPYNWLAGNKTTALNNPENVVLTQSRAMKYFPGKKPREIIGLTLTYNPSVDTTQKIITGIVADIKGPSEFTTQEFCSLPTKPFELVEWTNTNGSDKLYLQLKQGTKPSQVLAQIERIVSAKEREYHQKNSIEFKFKRWFQLLPLKDSHFSTYIEEYQTRKANKTVLFGLIGIGLFLLILASINYINISVASLPQRAKEIGVRKTLGSSHNQLIALFFCETMITTLLAVVIAQAISLLGFKILKDIIPEGITPVGNFWELLVFVIVMSLTVTLAAGAYPAWLITRVKTISVFRNSTIVQTRGWRFNIQKSLIVFQFVIALTFIPCALIVGRQLHFVLATNMGFDKDAVILVEVPWKYLSSKMYANRQFPLMEELKKTPGILNISLGQPPLSENYSSSQYEYHSEDKPPIQRQLFRKCVDTGYIRLYGIRLLAGRNLQPSDTANELVLNETAIHAFGFKSPTDALGKFMAQPFSNLQLPIVGVVKDFHIQSFYTTIDPVGLMSGKDNLTTFNIKLTGNNASNWQQIISDIERKWSMFFPPESFAYKFYDETLQTMYQQERHLLRLINLATAISIFISCLGLFGLVVLTAFQRTKEIGIRKVLGASVSGIVQLLSEEYLRLVLLATILATPIAWWATNKWLQNFAYRTVIAWWVFGLGALIGVSLACITVSLCAIKAAKANPAVSLRTE